MSYDTCLTVLCLFVALSAAAPRPVISHPAVVGQTPVVEPPPVLDHRPAVDMLGENEADRNTASNDVVERVEVTMHLYIVFFRKCIG